MMVQVNIGQILKKDTLVEGITQKGVKYLFATVKAEQGYDQIKVWAENADDLNKNSDLEIVSISSAKVTNRKVTKDGQDKWYTDYNVNAKLAKVAGSEIPEGFSMTDDDIPF